MLGDLFLYFRSAKEIKNGTKTEIEQQNRRVQYILF